MPTAGDLSRLPPRLRPLVPLLEASAADALAGFRAPGTGFEHKGDGSRVTIVDRRIDVFLRAELAVLGEGPVRSEEHVPGPGAGAMRDGWVVDPIDGTHPFTEGAPEFSVQVAHLEGGRPDLAAVALPARDELYLAERGRGVWRVGPGEGGFVPWRLPSEMRPTFRAHNWKFSAADRERMAAEVELRVGTWARAIGPMILSLCRGDARAVVSPPTLYDWDLAPPELIATELGARVTDLQGETLRYGRRDVTPGEGVVVTAPGVDHDRLVQQAGEAEVRTP